MVEELCKSQIVLIDDYMFNINDGFYRFYIDIITGKNEMVNAVCEQLNTTVAQGLKFEEWQVNTYNEIIVNINNLGEYDLTKYEKLITIKLTIKLSNLVANPLEYYINDSKQYKLKSVLDLKNVLDQLCTFEKLACSKNGHYSYNVCKNMVDIQKEFPNISGLYESSSKYMLETVRGYRCNYSDYKKHHFCSKECMDYYKTYNCCHRCNEDGQGTYVEELGYTLCNGRGDLNPPCIAQYELEQRFKKDYENRGFYELNEALAHELLVNCDELKKIIKANDNKITLSMLLDLREFHNSFEVRERLGADKLDKQTFTETCESLTKEIL